MDGFDDTVATSSRAQIAVYKGKPKQLCTWLECPEKVCLVKRRKLEDTELIKRSTRFSDGAVATFIQDTLKEFEQAQIIITWAILSGKLKDQFRLHLDLNSRIINPPKYAQKSHPYPKFLFLNDCLCHFSRSIRLKFLRRDQDWSGNHGLTWANQETRIQELEN